MKPLDLPFANSNWLELSIPMVGKILGHTQVQTTMRYAHFADDPVLEAATQVSGLLAGQISTIDGPPLLTAVK